MWFYRNLPEAVNFMTLVQILLTCVIHFIRAQDKTTTSVFIGTECTVRQWIVHSLAAQAARVRFPLPTKAMCNIRMVYLPLGIRWQVKEMEPDT